MKKKQKKYSLLKLLYTALIAPAFLWVVISTPFIYTNQDKLVKQDKMNTCIPNTGNEEDATNSFGDTAEGKITTDSNPFSDQDQHDYFSFVVLQRCQIRNTGIYNAFHDEIFVPPPNIAQA